MNNPFDANWARKVLSPRVFGERDREQRLRGRKADFVVFDDVVASNIQLPKLARAIDVMEKQELRRRRENEAYQWALGQGWRLECRCEMCRHIERADERQFGAVLVQDSRPDRVPEVVRAAGGRAVEVSPRFVARPNGTPRVAFAARGAAAAARAAEKASAVADRLARIRALPGVVSVPSLLPFRDRLERREWKRVGQGMFGSAYAKGLLVWKVSHGGRGNQDGYRRYAVDVVSGAVPKTPHAPRIRLVIVDDKGEFAVLMERMDRVLDMAPAATRISVSASIDRGKGWLRTGHLKDRDSLSLAAYVRYLRRKYGAHYHSDLHGENLMVARCGRIVVTDPLAGRKPLIPADIL